MNNEKDKIDHLSESDLNILIEKLDELRENLDYEKELKEIRLKNEELSHTIKELEHVAKVLIMYEYDEKVINFLNRKHELDNLVDMDKEEFDKLNNNGKKEVYVEGIYTHIKDMFVAIGRFIKSLLDKLINFFKRMFNKSTSKRVRKEAKELNDKVKRKKESDQKVPPSTVPSTSSNKDKQPMSACYLNEAPLRRSMEEHVVFLIEIINKLAIYVANLTKGKGVADFDFNDIKVLVDNCAGNVGFQEDFVFDKRDEFVMGQVKTKSCRFVESDYYGHEHESQPWFVRMTELLYTSESLISDLIHSMGLFCKDMDNEIKNLHGEESKRDELRKKLDNYAVLLKFMLTLSTHVQHCANKNRSTLASISIFLSKNT